MPDRLIVEVEPAEGEPREGCVIYLVNPGRGPSGSTIMLPAGTVLEVVSRPGDDA